MASTKVKACKARKRNFSVSETAILTENVEEHFAVLQSKLTNSNENKWKKKLWQEITAAVNAAGVESRTTTEVREKWKSLLSATKKEFSAYRQERQNTGHGPAPKSPLLATEKNNRTLQGSAIIYGPRRIWKR